MSPCTISFDSKMRGVTFKLFLQCLSVFAYKMFDFFQMFSESLIFLYWKIVNTKTKKNFFSFAKFVLEMRRSGSYFTYEMFVLKHGSHLLDLMPLSLPSMSGRAARSPLAFFNTIAVYYETCSRKGIRRGIRKLYNDSSYSDKIKTRLVSFLYREIPV